MSLGELFYPFTPGQLSHYLFSPQNSGFWTSERLCWPVRVEMVHYWFNILTLLRRPTKWSVQCMVRYCHSMGADLDEETKGFSFITFLLLFISLFIFSFIPYVDCCCSSCPSPFSLFFFLLESRRQKISFKCFDVFKKKHLFHVVLSWKSMCYNIFYCYINSLI